MEAAAALFWMLVGHAVADFPLQGPFLAEAKNRHTAIGAQFWLWALPAHAMIHAGAVALATGSLVLGLLEFVGHACIDFAKCEGWLDLHEDQVLHLMCKLAWALVLFVVTV